MRVQLLYFCQEFICARNIMHRNITASLVVCLKFLKSKENKHFNCYKKIYSIIFLQSKAKNNIIKLHYRVGVSNSMNN